MSSPFNPIRQRRKPDPVDTMLDEWRDLKAKDVRKDLLPPMSQLELMLLLLKRP
jgi:hypothetical protein